MWRKREKKTAIIHLGIVKKNYIYFYKQLNGNYAKRGEKKKRHERAQNKLHSAAINPRYRSNDTLSNYTSGKAVTVSWYQLRIISRSVYRLSTIYSRYESIERGRRAFRSSWFLFMQIANQCFTTHFSNELSFSILFSFDSPFWRKKKGWDSRKFIPGFEIYSAILWKGREKKKKRRIRNVPLLSDDYRLPSFGRWRVISLKRIITDLKRLSFDNSL